MMKVQNRKTVRRLALKSLGANRTRNLVAVLAIALTAMLFTSLFTIALSLNEGFQQSNFRQAGGYSHGTFKDLTEEQYNALKDDPLIEDVGVRKFLGMTVSEPPFNKSHIEVAYSDANNAHWMYCDPVEGRLPKEGTNEAATDTHVLALLGVEPKIGAEFTLPIEVDGQRTEQTFTLCGWWEYDEVIVANHVVVPQSRVDAVLDELDVTPPGHDGMTGNWSMDVMLKSGARHIEADMHEILTNNGYGVAGEVDDPDKAIKIGINWGYTGAQMSEKADPATVAAVVGMLALILLTGYLIIYNVFQISVAGDIRFYGLLKTIGTTPRQLARLIRIQALALSVAGIPLGLVLGWLVGRALVPVVVAQLDGIESVVSISPLIFVLSALFALVTVFVSCLRPERKAARVSPIEAVRYTEGSMRRKKARRKEKVSLFSMAVANLGRNRVKTVVTILSLGLAVVLLNITVVFVGGFDMDKYVSTYMAMDFKIANAGHLQVGGESFNDEQALPTAAINAVKAQGGITDGGVTYGKTTPVQESVTEEYFRSQGEEWYSKEELDAMVAGKPRNDDGTLVVGAQLYGMTDYPLDHLKVIEGDLSPLYESGSKAIAAVYSDSDYGEPIMDSHWAKVGDKVTLRYVESFEYTDPDTGAFYASEEDIPDKLSDEQRMRLIKRAKEYREETYTVTALVTVPYSLEYGYYGDDAFVLGADTFKADTGTEDILYYAFDTTDAATDDMEAFLADYTENIDPSLDYVSKDGYIAEFNSFRNMFLLLGGLLSFIIGLIGVLNFFNAILTGIASRRRELAMLQAVGMTGRQLRTMLIIEGLLYTVGAVALSLALSLAASPFLAQAMSNIFWFFTYRFTIWPVLLMFPLFGALGILIPACANHFMSKHSVIDRLRQE